MQINGPLKILRVIRDFCPKGQLAHRATEDIMAEATEMLKKVMAENKLVANYEAAEETK